VSQQKKKKKKKKGFQKEKEIQSPIRKNLPKSPYNDNPGELQKRSFFVVNPQTKKQGSKSQEEREREGG